MPDLDSFFSSSGALAQSVPGFRARSQQLAMAQAIADTITSNRVLVAEAGTGTGKTFAYLVPALLAGGKVIISTGTKTLQDQLFNRDIPTVRAALKAPVIVALLKGRSNYVCHYHLERTLKDGRTSFASRDEVKYLKLIERYAGVSKTGDKSGLSEVPESAAVWQQVTSTRENCLGSDCPSYKTCFVMEARKQALSADVVVVNHHLFFADVMLRDEGLSELLPACNTVIFDEAHQLPETASLFFGESVSTSQLLELARDAESESILGAKDFVALPDSIALMEKASRDLRLTIEGDNTRLTLAAVSMNPKFGIALDHLLERLEELSSLLESQSERSEGLENCWQRTREIAIRIKHWRDKAESEGFVRWLEVFSHALQLNATPLSIAEIFNKQLIASPRAWIFTSATLAVKGDFSHYNNEMGLSTAQSACWDSPFDFANQALLYVPTGLPDPSNRDYTDEVVKAALPVLMASRGRAFFLCTSLRATKRAHELLIEAFEREKLDYPILLQGQSSRSDMLDRFRKMRNAVLIGSQSFWEGVDVRGEALSLVVIDKLPFAPPDDPVLSARIEKINKEGRNAFMEYQLPRAVINLKQGAGRLIRDETDRGVLMICDPRLITKSYGKKIWQSLPPMKRTRDLAEVERFFR
ncbi:MAG: ATP-dependent DNA helicase [Nitrosomonadaceae bacterium]|nr:ATP-dependent DNA helicase [Nitrosomonadaceae bacterium]MDW7618823.1 ATP-dependent DNA helicase [Nitrosomonadaceae bacterium]MDW7646725.1 ATP-dependent DNA helicase [Nitrosomonadaceae bacterium]MDW7666880.1 ATP-dependent DNA helicase [Nitrosomonadaceae bacterium]GDX59281.1 ATP-dependent DNA helicase-like protein [Nitrosomonadaceae bacterium]